MHPRPLPALAAAVLAAGATQAQVSPERQQTLVHIVRQDCGACHGLQLTGGLGPAITRERMADFPYDSLVAVIYHGRPG
ncbi:MAG TPA: cytochrome c, partial [Burkholderiaceae bacterium]|nr:cytochrome c [Burkholderiaceae bacterium]